jgi:hypothetical protein
MVQTTEKGLCPCGLPRRKVFNPKSQLNLFLLLSIVAWRSFFKGFPSYAKDGIEICVNSQVRTHYQKLAREGSFGGRSQKVSCSASLHPPVSPIHPNVILEGPSRSTSNGNVFSNLEPNLPLPVRRMCQGPVGIL